jgi:hypothetical protein
MLAQIILGSAMIVVTTLVQGVFTVLGIEKLRDHLERRTTKHLVSSTLKLAALTTLEKAVYFSTVTFTTLGFGDITLDEEWRLLSSFEAANGLLMFGWTTALVFAAVQWVYAGRKYGGRP